MADKIIFLDVDGVLTSTKETPGSYLNHDLDEYGISPNCLHNLMLLCKKTGAKVIISSNWRNIGTQPYGEMNGKKIPNPLVKLYAELGDIIVGALPKTGFKTKADAIVKWFDENEFDGNFVVLDDDKEEHLDQVMLYSIGEHLVFTNYKVGLQRSDCEKALQILNAENATV